MAKTVGIIAEYNPFHNGHYYHLQKAKQEANADFCVAVISGNFTQRGETSIVNKWAKAYMAICGGADLVIELPTLYSVSSAENFANGAIKILDSLKIVDSFAFGAEAEDLATLNNIANVLYDENLNRWLLKKSAAAKDQSYFLYKLSQHQLSHILFPLEDHQKSYVREIAKKLNLPVAEKSESQDICFIPNGNHTEFILNNLDKKLPQGNFLDNHGNILGEHKGLINYTVGQRKGLGISAAHPLYVEKIDAKTNSIILCGPDEGYSSEIKIKDVNFIKYDNPTEPIKARVKIRYRATPTPCTVFPLNENEARIVFDSPQRFPAPGQSAVFYDDEEIVIGGGTIE